MGPNAMDLNESFQELEEKLSKAGEVIKRALKEKRDLQQAFEKLKQGSGDSREHLEALRREVQALRREREEIRIRVERLLSQIEQLTGSDSGEE